MDHIREIRNGGRASANGRSQRATARNQKYIDQDSLEQARLQVTEAKHELKLVKNKLDIANDIDEKETVKYNNWCRKYPFTEEEI